MRSNLLGEGCNYERRFKHEFKARSCCCFVFILACEDENGLSYCTPLVKWCHRSSLKNILKQQCFKSCGYC